MKHLRKFVFTIVIASLALVACGGLVSRGPVGKFANVTYQQVLQFKQYYADTYPKETRYSAAFNEWWAYMDNKLAGVKDAKFLSDNCYSNVLTTLENATIGMYDTGANADGTGNGVLDNSKLVSALVTNQLYPANADLCSQMLQSTLAEVVKMRTEGYELQRNFIEQRASLKNQYDGTLETATQRRLLDLYGQEFIAYMNDQLVSNGVEPFPADFIGWPTSGVEVHTKSRSWCQYYQDIASGVKAPGTPGMAKEMYGAAWIGPENGGDCVLTRQAAWEYTGRSFMSAANSNAQACGEGPAGLSGGVDENCNETQNNPSAPTQPAPTPVPATPSSLVPQRGPRLSL